MAHLLGAEALNLEYPTHIVFDSVTVGVGDGDRIGIVGRNGEGKSTLLALLAGRVEPGSGRVTHRRGVTRGFLDQADTLDSSLTVAATVVGGGEEHLWAGSARIRDVIAGLLADVPWTDVVGTLSGGQRRRVALAALLVGDHDILLLDEPTNHLDVEGIAWLARHLRSRWSSSGALLVVTHDRWFLDEVTTTTWEVHDRMIEPFEGGYASYILQRVERDRLAASSESKRQNLMRKELAWLGRGAPARSTKPKFRMDAALEIIANEPPPRDPIFLAQLATSRLGKDVVDIENVTVQFPAVTGDGKKTLLTDVTWRIGPGERVGILGANGAGKSTLLGLVAGSVRPTSGRVKRGKTVRVATLTQQLLELDAIADERVRTVIDRQRSSYVSGGKELTPGQLLERLGFSSAQFSTPVKDLSGGQKRRLQLLLVLLAEPNVLILDEPTNDLDTVMLAAIEDLLDSWAGTLIVVSHDRYLLERITDNQYAIINGALRHLPGGVEEFLALTARRTGEGKIVASASDKADCAPPSSGRSARPQLSGARRRVAEKELASVNRRIATVQSEIVMAHESLASHDQSDYVGLEVLLDSLRVLESRESELETRWLELTDALD